MSEKIASPGKSPRPKQWLFLLLTLLLMAITIEVGARIIECAYQRWQQAHLYQEDAFIASKNLVKVFELAPGGRVYQRSKYHWIMSPQQFQANKSADTLRIFCLGGSAALGWPHLLPHTYPFLLQQKLQKLYPQRRIEVLNVAGNTYASYRVKVVFDEIVEYQPDLVVIYSGNNEFLENFVYRDRSSRDLSSGLPSPWRHSALLRLSWQLLPAGRQTSKYVFDIEDYGMADQTANRLSFAFGHASRRRQDPQQFQRVLAHYRYNIAAMVKKCRQKQVPIMILTVPVNLKDWHPNVSIHSPKLAAATRQKWQQHFVAGLTALESKNDKAALAQLLQAAALDPEYAETHYRLGQIYHRQGRLYLAKASFYRAVQYDGYPFRCLPQFNDILRQISTAVKVPLVDITAAIARSCSRNGIIGLDAMVDYVHPTAVANEIIAHQVLLAMARHKLLPANPTLALAQTRIALRPDIEKSILVLRALYRQYLIMRQYDKLDGLARTLRAELKKAMPTLQGEELADANKLLRRLQETQRVIPPYQRLLQAEKLGRLDRKFTREQAQRIYRDYIEMIRRLEARKISNSEFETFVPQLQYRQN